MRRCTYEQVNELFSGKSVPFLAPIAHQLFQGRELSLVLEACAAGAEPWISSFRSRNSHWTSRGVPWVCARERGEANRMIEQFMLQANECVADFMLQRNPVHVPCARKAGSAAAGGF